MRFKVKENNAHGIQEWYIGNKKGYLWKDLKVYGSTGWGRYSEGRVPGDSPGYYATKAEAERYLRAYEVSQMKFIVRQCQQWPERGWYIVTDTGAGYWKEQFVWKDLQLHEGTGYDDYSSCIGGAPGYYRNLHQAKTVLKQFKEKHNMTEDKLVISVKVNGVDTPLHEISEQTLLKIREASKPKPVPVFQVCDWTFTQQRLIFKVSQEMADNVGRYILLTEDGKKVGSYDSINDIDTYYTNRRELKLDKV